MSTIPKLIKDTEKYFQYEGSANPTTQDELQAYMKNEHSVVECLTDALWQPETVYTIGHIVKSPNMPKGFQAVCLVNGTSSSNEPDWGSGATDINDGSTKWKVTTANITVNGISPDASGNIALASVSTSGSYNDLTDKPTIPDATTSQKGVVKVGSNITVSSGTISLTKSNVTNALGYTPPTSSGLGTDSNIYVSGSTQPYRQIHEKTEATRKEPSNGPFNAIDSTWASIGSGDNSYTCFYYTTNTGLGAGTYTLQNLLQQLVNRSHTHSTTKRVEKSNCNCDCSDSCIIDGDILTDKGYKHISKLQVNDYVIGNDNKPHKVMGIITSMVKNRKAVFFAGIPSAILTDDHLFLLSNDSYGAYDIEGYYRQSRENCTDGNVFGTYSRLEEKDIIDLSKNNCVVKYNNKDYGTYLCEKQLPYDTVTYTPIVEDCEWVILNGIIVACARYVD